MGHEGVIVQGEFYYACRIPASGLGGTPRIDEQGIVNFFKNGPMGMTKNNDIGEGIFFPVSQLPKKIL